MVCSNVFCLETASGAPVRTLLKVNLRIGFFCFLWEKLRTEFSQPFRADVLVGLRRYFHLYDRYPTCHALWAAVRSRIKQSSGLAIFASCSIKLFDEQGALVRSCVREVACPYF